MLSLKQCDMRDAWASCNHSVEEQYKLAASIISRFDDDETYIYFLLEDVWR